MNKVLITGSSGLVGSRLLELSSFKNHFLTPTEKDLNISDRENTSQYLDKNRPDAVIHLAAYTNVSEAEKQKGVKDGLCWQLNVQGTKNIIESLPDSCYFIQISTDMVFSGDSDDPGPYDETRKIADLETKVTWYGYTKGLAEKTVRDRFKDRAVILRLIYPVRAKFKDKMDYLRKPLQLFDQGKLYPMFTDQQISLSFIDEICLVLDKLLQRQSTGIFHASSSDLTTPFAAVSYLIEKARNKTRVVQKVSLEQFLKTVNNPVRYPQFGGLKVWETEKTLGIKFSSWRQIIDQLIEQGIEV